MLIRFVMNLASLNRSSPPPPSFNGGRQMLPPTSPPYIQAQYNGQTSTSRSHPPPTTFARDLSAPSSTHRPGSSMSISSMLGSDPDKSSRDPIPSTRRGSHAPMTVTPIPPPSTHSIPLPSPPHLIRRNGAQNETVPKADGANTWRNESARRPHSNPIEPPQREVSGLQIGSPQVSRYGLFTRDLQNQNTMQRTNTQESIDQREYQEVQGRRASLTRIDHPNASNHFGYMTSSTEAEIDSKTRPVAQDNVFGNVRGTEMLSGRSPIVQENLQRVNEPHYHTNVERVESWNTNSPTVKDTSRVSYDSRQGQANAPSGTNYPFLTRPHDQSTPPGCQNRANVNSLSERNTEPRLDDLLSPTKSSNATEAFRRLRDSAYSGSNMTHQDIRESTKHTTHTTSRFSESLDYRQSRDSPRVTARTNGQNTSHTDQHLGIMYEGPDQPKASLGLLVDNNKRWGRISPLPQAVQGAQGQKRGPASEPGIKNEFARMFSGIGSGVGSGMPTPVPNEPGASISFPSSPTRLEEYERRTPFSGRGDLLELMKPRASSRGGRRGKKLKEEDPKTDLVACESLTESRPVSTRGTKRSRHSHHHHPHAHQ